jgi:hypothetical protein
MPTFLALQCFQCRGFSVQQETKNRKWTCKRCGAAQSIQRRFFTHAAASAVRAAVQQLSGRAAEVEDARRAAAHAAAAGGGMAGSSGAGAGFAPARLPPRAAPSFPREDGQDGGGWGEDEDVDADAEGGQEAPHRHRPPAAAVGSMWAAYLDGEEEEEAGADAGAGAVGGGAPPPPPPPPLPEAGAKRGRPSAWEDNGAGGRAGAASAPEWGAGRWQEQDEGARKDADKRPAGAPPAPAQPAPPAPAALAARGSLWDGFFE